jgi:hypothetical protein
MELASCIRYLAQLSNYVMDMVFHCKPCVALKVLLATKWTTAYPTPKVFQSNNR